MQGDVTPVLLADPGSQQAADAFPWQLLGIPSALVAFIVLVAYSIGLIRPVAIKHATYVGVGSATDGATHLYCTIKNRKVNLERTLTGLALVAIPSLWYRLYHWRWRQEHWDQDSYGLWGDQVSRIVAQSIMIRKRDEVQIMCEIRLPGGTPMRPGEHLPESVRLFAYFGTSRAAMKKPSFESRS